MKKAGQLVIYSGTMTSGKTTELQREERRRHIAALWRGNYLSLLVVPRIDTRNRDPEYAMSVSHDGIMSQAEQFDSMSEVLEYIKALPRHCVPHDLFVDEGQFLVQTQEDVDAVLTIVSEWGINVYMATLKATAEMKPWPYIPRLWAVADKCITLAAICVKCGTDAYHVKRLGPVPSNGSPIDVGGTDKYIPVCRNCHLKHDASTLRDSPDVKKYMSSLSEE